VKFYDERTRHKIKKLIVTYSRHRVEVVQVSSEGIMGLPKLHELLKMCREVTVNTLDLVLYGKVLHPLSQAMH
jgi:hypothetical protein